MESGRDGRGQTRMFADSKIVALPQWESGCGVRSQYMPPHYDFAKMLPQWSRPRRPESDVHRGGPVERAHSLVRGLGRPASMGSGPGGRSQILVRVYPDAQYAQPQWGPAVMAGVRAPAGRVCTPSRRLNGVRPWRPESEEARAKGYIKAAMPQWSPAVVVGVSRPHTARARTGLRSLNGVRPWWPESGSRFCGSCELGEYRIAREVVVRRNR